MCGYPSDKTAFMRRVEREGATYIVGEGARGQRGRLYLIESFLEDLKSSIDGTIPSKAICPPVSRYQEASRGLKAQADERLYLLRLVKEGIASATSLHAALVDVAVDRGVPQASLKRWWKLVKDLDEAAWRDALVPAYKPRQATEIDRRLWAAFRDDYGRQEQPQAHAVWERVKKRADDLGIACPHEKTFLRRFRALPAAQQVLMREGEKALDELYPHQARDRSGMLPLDSCNSDGREWDLRVLWPDGETRRPVVTLAEDDATHFIVAFEVDVVESAAGYRRVYRHICTTYGVPKKMRYDNTRAAANKSLTAGAKGRKRFKDQDDDLDGLLKDLGTEVSFALVRNGKTKGSERVFAEIKERTEKHPRMAGAYTGRSPSEKPANYGEAAVPLAVFEEVLREEVDRYHATIRTRSEVVQPGSSYGAAFAAGLELARPRRLTRTEEIHHFRAKKLVTLNASGEFFIGTAPNRHRYFHEALMDYAARFRGQKIVVRFDENDMAAPVYVEGLDGAKIVEAAPRLEAGAFNSTAQASEHGRAKKRHARAAKEQLKQERAMDAALAAEAATHEPTPGATTAVAAPKVVTADFGSKAHQAKREPEAAPVERDPSKVAAVRAAMRGDDFKPSAGPNLELLKRGQEFLARKRAG